MRSPSTKRLRATFDLEPGQATLIKRLCALVDDRDALEALINEKCEATAAYARSCYHSPWTSAMWRRTMVLHAIDKLIGGFGMEPLGEVEMRGPKYEYSNMGDPYVTTLLYSRDADNLFIGCWGTTAEAQRL